MQPTNKITWLGTKKKLRYLIKKIDGIGIEKLGKQIWEITTSYFVDDEGKAYTISQLRYTKPPKDLSRIKPAIDYFQKYSSIS